MTAARLSEPAVRSERLSAATDAMHQHLHTLVAAAAPFDDRERYSRFAIVQYQFQSEIDPLYRRDSLQLLIPDLASRSRLAAVSADLADLDVTPPSIDFGVAAAVDDYAALGWLFVSEGSTLGAAMLLKRVQMLGLSETFGARYLAPATQGRARHWKQFVEALDGLPLTDEQDAQVSTAADAAFQRFAELIKQAFQL
jgi:heme oxygenase